MKYLTKINSPSDLKKLSVSELNDVAEEIRSAVITRVEGVGGHFGSNLGIVELTTALHYVFSSPVDKIVFDVSHQCYAHKIITGRRSAFTDSDKFSSVSGFTVPSESEHDVFQIGHTGTSVSLACGLAKARDLQKQKHNVIAVIGDGALSGGEAFEGLDNASTFRSNLIIVVNDNEMSIAPNQGGLYRNLKLLRETGGKAELNFFKAFGFDYRYVEEGNDVEKLVEAFESVKDIDHPVVVHVHTLKGKGVKEAMENKEGYHWANAKSFKGGAVRLEDLTAEYLLERMKTDERIVAISSATPSAQGLTPAFREKAKQQFVDVGIAEEHAVAFASALARGGAKPVYLVAASFVQRAFDQLIQDLSLNSSPAVVLVFNGGMSSADATHVGSLVYAETSCIPNAVCLAPCFKEEYFEMLSWALSQDEKTVIINVPKTVESRELREHSGDVLSAEVTGDGDVAFVGIGESYLLAERCAKLSLGKTHKAFAVNPRIYSDLDEKMLEKLSHCKVVVTLENGILDCGFGEKVARLLGRTNAKVLCYGAKKEFSNRVPLNVQNERYRLKEDLILQDVLQLLD